MSIKPSPPDYELLDALELTTPAQVRAISDPLRTTILGLLHERAATVTELATAVKRPKSTVAHHVGVRANAGILRVVRSRRVRGVGEGYYGPAGGVFYRRLGSRADSMHLQLCVNASQTTLKYLLTPYTAEQSA